MTRTTSTSKKKTSTAQRRPGPAQAASEALKNYEEALKVFRRSDHARAVTLFEAIIKDYPGEREICDRCRTWILAAKRHLAPGLPTPKTVDDHYYQGVLAANEGRLEEAATHFANAASQDPRSDRAHYALAAISAQRGEVSGAAEHLAKAIEINASNRVRALNDTDFDALRDDPEFMTLLGKRPEV